jgi:cellulose synthase/poly-beta-1,6-N-acetylglucosamine synthase-like glycosyltransferase
LLPGSNSPPPSRNVSATAQKPHRRAASNWGSAHWASLLGSDKDSATTAAAAPAAKLEKGKMEMSLPDVRPFDPTRDLPQETPVLNTGRGREPSSAGASGGHTRWLSRAVNTSKDVQVNKLNSTGGGNATPAGSARGAGHTRWLSKGRVDQYQKAAGLKQVEGTGYQDDAVMLTRHSKPDPQAVLTVSSAMMMRMIMLVNVITSLIYLHWRVTKTIWPLGDVYFFYVSWLPAIYWAWVFFFTEVFLVIGIWIGHVQRLFPVQRTVVTMDDLVVEDESVGYNARVAILCPTSGERLDIVMHAIMGAVSQRLWRAGSHTNSQTLRVIVLDEKRRKAVLDMTAAIYALATILRNKNITSILHAEGVVEIHVQSFYEWWKGSGGYARKHLYNDNWLNKACMLLEFMVKNAVSEGGALFSLKDMPDDLSLNDNGKRRQEVNDFVMAMLGALNVPDTKELEPAYLHTFSSNPDLPTLCYYTRRDPGTPKVSPKAGNMNSAIFAYDDPGSPALIGDVTMVAVNDCRHKLMSNFLQRTVPYLFELDETCQHYGWAKVAFVQTPQRFPQDVSYGEHDLLGNSAAIQYDVINHGKDGIGAVSSSGHGSVWRLESLRGASADGKRYCDPSLREKIGEELGFRSEMLIEDTHTSIECFRHGWESRYINEPNEWLSECTHQPNSLSWRIRQVLRWHQGAVQLLFYKGVKFSLWTGEFPTVFHRIYAFDQSTYYLQAIPGYILLLMPIIYGITGQSPFETDVDTFFMYFTPFIVTAFLPTVISGSWRGVESEKLQRDEQIWLSTTYVQVFAFLSMLWTSATCRKHENAWAVNAPTWPLFAVFFGEFVAIGGALFWVSQKGFDSWSKNLISIIVSACLSINALWPMVSLQLGWQLPSQYYVKILSWILLGALVIVVSNVGSPPGVEKFIESGVHSALKNFSLTV